MFRHTKLRAWGLLVAGVARAILRSDFRDTGLVLAPLLRARGTPSFTIEGLELVDDADVLGAPEPTWVAAPLIRARS